MPLSITTFWRTTKRRWWVLVVFPALATFFVWAQQPKEQPSEISYIVSQSYELTNPSSILSLVGIDVSLIKSFPSVAGQAQVLQSPEVKEEVSRAVGGDFILNVKVTAPTASLLDLKHSEKENSLQLATTGTETYNFFCTERTSSKCKQAIKIYVLKASQLRKTALISGLKELRSSMEKLEELDSVADFQPKILAIDSLISNLDITATLISTYEESGSVLKTSRPISYRLAIGAGGIISLLVLLQLSYSDKQVRSRRALLRVVRPELILGNISRRTSGFDERIIALRVLKASEGAKAVRLVPLHSHIKDVSVLTRILKYAELRAEMSQPLLLQSVDTIASQETDTVEVILIAASRDSLPDVRSAQQLVEQFPGKFIGFIVLD